MARENERLRVHTLLFKFRQNRIDCALVELLITTEQVIEFDMKYPEDIAATVYHGVFIVIRV